MQKQNTNEIQEKISALSEIVSVDNFLMELNKNSNTFFYGESNTEQYILQHIIIESFHHLNKHLLIYDKNIMDSISDARRIIIHKIIPTFSKKSRLSVINIIFEKYEKVNLVLVLI